MLLHAPITDAAATAFVLFVGKYRSTSARYTNNRRRLFLVFSSRVGEGMGGGPETKYENDVFSWCFIRSRLNMKRRLSSGLFSLRQNKRATRFYQLFLFNVYPGVTVYIYT